VNHWISGCGIGVYCANADGQTPSKSAIIRVPMRFWIIDLPAFLIDGVFKAYFVFIAVMALLCFGMVLIALASAALGLPSPV
jgi:hypothetical protein